jgi:hypothetical protein
MIDNQLTITTVIKNLVIFGLIVFGVGLLVKIFKAETTEDMTKHPWIEQHLGPDDVTLTLPVELKHEANDQHTIDVYSYDSRHLAIFLQRIEVNDTTVMSRDEMTKRLFENFSTAMQMKNIVFQQTEASRGISRHQGSYNMDSQDYHFGDLSFFQSRSFYTLLIYYPAKDRFGDEIRARIFNEFATE